MSIFSKLKSALTKSSNKISSSIENIFIKKKLDANTLEELEDMLIESDLGVDVASDIIQNFKKNKFDKEVEIDFVKETLADAICEKLAPCNKSFLLDEDKLNVIIMCGVNGNGKTTTVGKLASKYSANGQKVGVVACDTFRAAAKEQLEVWANRSNVTLFTGLDKSDPASVAFSAVEKSLTDSLDILLIDTAGRLHNHKNLMDELGKVIRVISKFDDKISKQILLVLDAGLGQNAYNQVTEFKNLADISGLIITKLDGTAKAGIVVGIASKFKLPIYFIGIGEQIEDLREFESKNFALSLVGL
jgi:fused signal recognition particle receptor